MRKVMVEYMLSDEDEKRLREITEEYKRNGLNISEDRMFESIMYMGSKFDIDKKLKFHEWKLGLRED